MSDPITLIQLINQSSRIPNDAMPAIAHALGFQQANHVAPIHGITPAIEWYHGNPDPKDGVTPGFIIDVPDVEGALGYHDTDDNGNAFLKVFVNPILDNGGTVNSGDNSLSAVISHEVCEAVRDTDANLWADGPESFDYAYELCDPVESDSYDIEGVSVSNFVYPAFFQPKYAGKSGLIFDFMKKLPGPFKMSPGGYLIQRSEPGRVTDIFAARPGSVHIDQGIVLSFGPKFPAWKRPFKMRKAMKAAAHNHLRHTGKKYPGKNQQR